MTRVAMGGLVLVGLLAGAAFGADEQKAADGKEAKPKPVLCPVTEKPVDWRIARQFRKRWVYFATEAAREKFKQDPFEYSDRVVEQWEANPPVRLQVKCPVTGKPVDEGVFVGEGLTAVYFANDKAKKQYAKEPKKYAKRLEKECYTYQTLCAHSDQPIDPEVSREIEGRTVYFRCPHCAAAFMEEKAEWPKLLKKLDAQIAKNKKLFVERTGKDKPEKQTAEVEMREDKRTAENEE
jgi:YHS domain-containing protein